MADSVLPVAGRAVESLPARRARVLRRIEETRAGIAADWADVERAVEGGAQRSRIVMGALRTRAKWALALAALWILRRRRGGMTWPRAALLGVFVRAAAKQLVHYWYRGERHAER